MTTKIFLADLAHTYSVKNESLPIPLNIGYIKAYAVYEHKDAVDIQLFKHPEKFLDAAIEDKPDIIGFANYGWNENLNKVIGSYIRKKLPDTLMVAGGPNIDFTPESRLAFLTKHSYLDYLVIDSGEEPFSELITWWHSEERNIDALPDNLVWKEAGLLKSTNTRKVTKKLHNLQSPYLSGYLDEFIEANMIPLFETNRGCPFKCTFCAWGSSSKDLVRQVDIDVVLEEIDYVGKRSKSNNWIVCDANFGILKRDVDIAKKIANIKKEYGAPQKCHIWLAKNATKRNLEIGEILGDMTVPVMAVQTLEDDVLKYIKRDNISTDTYVEYQKNFHAIGSKTYSDLIVPLPGETLATHIDAQRKLFSYGVDIIQNHNMRLLAGAETNSEETRSNYNFKTRYRLIHGDAGIYQCKNGDALRAFEYEESLRSTSTMSEEEIFYLRKLHFLIDFSWNIQVYRPLLKVGLLYGINPIDVLTKMIESSEPNLDNSYIKTAEFFIKFNEKSREEWFDSANEIEDYFYQTDNFNSLVNQEYDKLNILFSIILLRDYKYEFDNLIKDVLESFGVIPDDVMTHSSKLTFSLFPSLANKQKQNVIRLPNYLLRLNKDSIDEARKEDELETVLLEETDKRRNIMDVIEQSKGQTLSKILNTQGFALRDLRMNADKLFSFDEYFHIN